MQEIDNQLFVNALEMSQSGVLLHRGGEIIYVNKQIESIVEEKIDISKGITLFDFLINGYKQKAEG